MIKPAVPGQKIGFYFGNNHVMLPTDPGQKIENSTKLPYDNSCGPRAEEANIACISFPSKNTCGFMV